MEYLCIKMIHFSDNFLLRFYFMQYHKAAVRQLAFCCIMAMPEVAPSSPHSRASTSEREIKSSSASAKDFLNGSAECGVLCFDAVILTLLGCWFFFCAFRTAFLLTAKRKSCVKTHVLTAGNSESVAVEDLR